MRHHARTVGLLMLVAVAGCKKEGRSPEYRTALAEHAQLVGKQGEDAYLLPRMAELEVSLAQVSTSSDDFPGAIALMARIRDERARVEAEARTLAHTSQHLATPEPVSPPTSEHPAPLPSINVQEQRRDASPAFTRIDPAELNKPRPSPPPGWKPPDGVERNELGETPLEYQRPQRPHAEAPGPLPWPGQRVQQR